ncbi:signal peptidase complex subunit 2, putative [Plasmodium berghei]|uniref:Signal peptidase complex subunit 2 n=2 Tax=Plasmodium berghei TaxID=5821 RepID=A0A509ANF1_PLABA|nr:signal peptidase complex subunit 2, putative [Plasmodium berghei ANKA]CXI76753.1 signal peptidase complex subunit 2, putative [Plasmodium berghei]SCM24963.1 signal peptidase complex subunit 2, putative [Plasmodium berghei]SCN27221.1 signal peptidase complex subunit 2, putative [Plasmodium berghei]SCO61796.1 signal peptidase complex subunit 2, putative [Plasmodium berghei]SCO63645.1 signal peptidase complex subunit 2, putative [Plasmodium berghei]|eukprot:XP_034422856.1 signal peptidase complex subunit 2, putative [Plasmodium berghei ANKA]
MFSKKSLNENKDNTHIVRNLYSENELKKVTQDYLSEEIRNLNIYENVQYSNIRILLSIILIIIGGYCCIFVNHKKEPILMMQSLASFFSVSIILYIWEYFYFEDYFMIIETNDDRTVKLFLKLDIKTSCLTLNYKLNKTVYSTPFELMKLYNEEGHLMKDYVNQTLKQFISSHGKNFKLIDKK